VRCQPHYEQARSNRASRSRLHRTHPGPRLFRPCPRKERRAGAASPQMQAHRFHRPGRGPCLWLELLSGIERESGRLGFSLLLRLTRGSQEAEMAAIEEMLAQDIAGLIVFPVNGERYNPALLRLYLSGVPVVLVDRYFRGLDIASVSSDNEAAAKEAVTYLIDSGHRAIAVLSPPPEGTVTIED